MNKNYSHIRAAIYGQPWLITKDGLDLITGIVENRLAGIEPDKDFLNALQAANDQKKIQTANVNYTVRNGVAIIPVMGPIIPRASFFSRISGVSSYEEILAAFSDALERPEVATVLLNFDSPGGAVSGCFETGTDIYEARKSADKPIIGLANTKACSAAYNLLAQCDAAFCTEAALVGSIGVICQMDNTDRMEKNMGNDSIVLRSEELKAPGVGAMTPNQMMSIQKQMMKFDAMFDESVKRGRPNVKIEDVSTGECWIGQDAVDMGLVDGISTLDELISGYGQSRGY